MKARKIKALLAALFLGLGLAVATPAPAQASGETCADWALCIFEYDLSATPNRYVINEQSSGFCFNIPSNWDNRADSAWNRTNKAVSFYTGNYCAGSALVPEVFNANGPKTIAFTAFDTGEANSVMFWGTTGCFDGLNEIPCWSPAAASFPVDQAVPQVQDEGQVVIFPTYPCPQDNTICLFDFRCCLQPAYRYVINAVYGSFFCFNLPADWDNRVDLVVNRSNRPVSFYTGNYCSGTPLSPSRFNPDDDYERQFSVGDGNEANSMMFHPAI